MPHMDETKTLKLIRGIDPDIRIIVVSGYDSASRTKELSQQGAYIFFQKFVDLMQFARSCRAYSHPARSDLIDFSYKNL